MTMDTPQQLPALGDYVDLRTLLPSVQHTFPSHESLKWFVRQHRSDLAAAGALINITGRLRLHPDRFQAIALEIGKKSV
jgi:hypothetical protein